MCNINYTVIQKYTHKILIFQSVKKKHESKYYYLTLLFHK
jgi:predicted transcriptional regulator